MKITTILILGTFLTGCEGFKILTLHNSSKSDARVIVKSGITNFRTNNIYDYREQVNGDSTIVIIQPDSSMVLLSIFTGLMFKVKISERDLRINYLRIETKKDTIIADSKQNIIALLKNNKTKYRRKTDKDKVMANGRNIGNIFIRE